MKKLACLTFAACLLATNLRAQQTLHVAIVSRTLFYIPLWIASEQGLFKQNGLTVDIEVIDSAEAINEQLRAGRSQIAISTTESAIQDAVRGGPLRIIAGNAGKLPFFIIARPQIKSMAQLRGARVGVLSLQEGTTYVFHQIAHSVGLAPSDYAIVQVGGAPTRWTLLKEGKIDVGLQPIPLSYQADDAGFSNLGAVSSYIPVWQFTSINVNESWAKAHSAEVAAFLRALRQGFEYMKAHPPETAALAARELRTTEALAKRALEDTEKLGILDPTLVVSRPGLERVFDSLVQSGQLPAGQHLDWAVIVNDSYLLQSRQR